jgi:hypothetical protein
MDGERQMLSEFPRACEISSSGSWRSRFSFAGIFLLVPFGDSAEFFRYFEILDALISKNPRDSDDISGCLINRASSR